MLFVNYETIHNYIVYYKVLTLFTLHNAELYTPCATLLWQVYVVFINYVTNLSVYMPTSEL